MMNKSCLEAFDRISKDLLKSENEENSKKSFGCKVLT